MTSAVHNGCRLCFQTEGTCWREDMAQRYREMRARRPLAEIVSRPHRRIVRRLTILVLAPIFGTLTGGAMGTVLWILARAHMTGAGVITESVRYWHG